MDALEQLRLENQQLRELLAQRDRLIEQLQQRIRDLEGRLDEALRSAKRQAAPFSKGPPKKRPKKPGRKAGEEHGRHGHREPPPLEKIDETLEATLPEQCPDCGGAVVEDRLDHQFQTEIPVKPIIRKFNIHCGHCSQCGKSMRGRHPLQTSDATGAACSQLGANAQAAIVYLNKHAGVSHGKIVGIFDKLHGISFTRGAAAQIVLRCGRICRPVYEELIDQLCDVDHLTPDETGWRVGGRPVWLHAWVGGDGTTVYAIDPQRSADVLEKVIGIDWSGSMTHDGFSSYDRFEDATHQQCVDHALRRARGLLERHTGAAKMFPQRVIDLFTEALQVRDRFQEDNVDFEKRGHAYEEFTERLRELTLPARPNEANARFAKHLANHSAAWFAFLLDPNITATNHRAEQALKTPIVNRKVWGGNRTANGAEAQVIICSVMQTLGNLARDAFDYFSNAFRGVLGNVFATGR